MVYPRPQRPAGLVEEAFRELHARWRPVLDLAQENGISIAFELHPGSDLFDGATFERFLEVSGGHPAAGLPYDPSHFVLQQLEYLAFIGLYEERIRSFHVKDAECYRAATTRPDLTQPDAMPAQKSVSSSQQVRQGGVGSGTPGLGPLVTRRTEGHPSEEAVAHGPGSWS
jgi:sugar phosphate isomerase/epimerase